MGIPDGALYSTLRVEFETNALYSSTYASGDNATVADLANGTATPRSLTNVVRIDARIVQYAVKKAEYDALVPIDRDNWRDLVNVSLQDGFVVNDPGYQSQTQAIWSGTATLTAFEAFEKRDATEFEKFWNDQGFVFDTLGCTVDDVRKAKATA